jgi:5'-nucleotidase
VNDLSVDLTDPLVEVILLSRNDPDTGLRVLKTIEHYGLGMTRAIFMQGKSPYEYIPALNIALFLSGDKKDVEAAIQAGYPAGQVLDSKFEDDETDKTLRIAFDFDGVLAGDESETIMQASGLSEFHAHEVKNVMQLCNVAASGYTGPHIHVPWRLPNSLRSRFAPRGKRK